MDEQCAWLRARKKKRLRFLAVTLSFCLLTANYSDIFATTAASATEAGEMREDAEDTGVTEYTVLDFEELAEEVREQTVPLGTAYEELTLPEEIAAVVAWKESAGTQETEEKEALDEEEPSDGVENNGEAPDGGVENNGETPDGGGENASGNPDGENGDGGNDDGEENGGDDGGKDDGEENGDEDAGGDNGEDKKEETGGEGADAGETEEGGTEEKNHGASGESGDVSAESAQDDSAEAVSVQTFKVEMPTYQAEPQPQTINVLEGSVAEETRTIPVTWESTSAYEADTPGEYSFTPHPARGICPCGGRKPA